MRKKLCNDCGGDNFLRKFILCTDFLQIEKWEKNVLFDRGDGALILT